MSDTNESYLQELASHYETVPSKIGFARKCRMHLPDGLSGMRIIDIGCRNGKGVMKLAGRAGESGFVLGVDWLPAHVEAAKEYSIARGNDRSKEVAPRTFLVAYPEALDAAGVPEAEFDAAFVNCSMNLFYDIPKAFAQIKRCLKPGGLLIVDGVFADGPRDARVVEQARKIDNSVQAAPALNDFLQLLESLQFLEVSVDEGETVPASLGFTDDTTVACVNDIESIGFKVFVIQAKKD